MPALRRPRPTGNRLLDRLPEDVYRRLTASLEPVPLTLKQPLHRAGAAPGYTYFPTAGMVSLLVLMQDGRECEVMTIGNEGVVGGFAVLGVGEAPYQATCQIGGAALRMPVRSFPDAAEKLPAFGTLLRRYAAVCFRNAGQVAACNALHSVEQRLSRWLLAAHDRAAAESFPLTQEFLAEMLGVRRQTVSAVAAGLQRTGLIRYRRGVVHILDRQRLGNAACECYQAMKASYLRTLG